MSWWDFCLHFMAEGALCLGFLGATPPSGTAPIYLPSSVVPGHRVLMFAALPNLHPPPGTRDAAEASPWSHRHLIMQWLSAYCSSFSRGLNLFMFLSLECGFSLEIYSSDNCVCN